MENWPDAFSKVQGIQVSSTTLSQSKDILTPEALAFLVQLHRKFNTKRLHLLEKRQEIQMRLDAGEKPSFLSETKDIREAPWTVASLYEDIQDRRVEITGPVNRKMVINALNSGANMYMADFEDSHSPTWEGTLEGQINLRDAVRGTVALETSEKTYRLNPETATLWVRPRGWHLDEKHVTVDGQAMSGSLFDFGLFFFHTAKTLLRTGRHPYFYLPKLENHREARLWNDVFSFSETTLGMAHGSIRATVLIETILAVFEMHEILYELKDYCAGLNCGRWDYIFSFIKKFRNDPTCVLPDRSQVTMNVHFLKSYSQLLIQTCHKRHAHAMGGMAAQIPIRDNPKANEIAMHKVREDKLREVNEGHDGTWVAHPALVPLAKEVFDTYMKTPHQIHNHRKDVRITADDLLRAPEGTITEEGLRINVNVGLRYLESWLRGVGCVPLYNLMEDAATAEISRSQIWQWIRHPKGKLNTGDRITPQLFRKVLKEEVWKIQSLMGKDVFEKGQFSVAAEIYDRIITQDVFEEFLTLPAYHAIP